MLDFGYNALVNIKSPIWRGTKTVCMCEWRTTFLEKATYNTTQFYHRQHTNTPFTLSKEKNREKRMKKRTREEKKNDTDEHNEFEHMETDFHEAMAHTHTHIVFSSILATKTEIVGSNIISF